MWRSGCVFATYEFSIYKFLNLFTALQLPTYACATRFASIPVRNDYSPTAQQLLPNPDAKERTALLAVPYIASLESDSICPALSHLLDARETGAWPFSRRRE